MPGFDPDLFADMMDDYIEIADANIKQEYKRELNALKGLSPAQIKHFGGTTSQMDEIIKEFENAKLKNLKQAALIDNLKKLGQSTYDLAKKVSALVP
jgi:predicted urease superfamily metal-dependent hydrolase